MPWRIIDRLPLCVPVPLLTPPSPLVCLFLCPCPYPMNPCPTPCPPCPPSAPQVELAPRFFKAADPHRLSRRKRYERIEPLYDKYNDPNAWRLSKRRG